MFFPHRHHETWNTAFQWIAVDHNRLSVGRRSPYFKENHILFKLSQATTIWVAMEDLHFAWCHSEWQKKNNEQDFYNCTSKLQQKHRRTKWKKGSTSSYSTKTMLSVAVVSSFCPCDLISAGIRCLVPVEAELSLRAHPHLAQLLCTPLKHDLSSTTLACPHIASCSTGLEHGYLLCCTTCHHVVI